MALETEIPRNHLYPVPIPPELLHIPSGMARTQFRALGTTVSLLVPEEHLQLGEEIVRTLFADWEQILSRFLPESELSQLNLLAGKPVVVSMISPSMILMVTALSSTARDISTTPGAISKIRVRDNHH